MPAEQRDVRRVLDRRLGLEDRDAKPVGNRAGHVVAHVQMPGNGRVVAVRGEVDVGVAVARGTADLAGAVEPRFGDRVDERLDPWASQDGRFEDVVNDDVIGGRVAGTHHARHEDRGVRQPGPGEDGVEAEADFGRDLGGGDVAAGDNEAVVDRPLQEQRVEPRFVGEDVGGEPVAVLLAVVGAGVVIVEEAGAAPAHPPHVIPAETAAATDRVAVPGAAGGAAGEPDAIGVSDDSEARHQPWLLA